MFEFCFSATGIRTGLSVPMHSTLGGAVGYIVFSTRAPLEELQRNRRACEDTLLAIAHRFHHDVEPYLAVSETPGGARLTDREIDCLSLTAIGKTLEEAAIILTLSSSTVRFHLRNACRKLGAANRMQAVSKAPISACSARSTDPRTDALTQLSAYPPRRRLLASGPSGTWASRPMAATRGVPNGQYRRLQAAHSSRPRHIARGGTLCRAGTAGLRTGRQGQHDHGIEEIIVTAQRREESIQRTPIAVTALSGADLDARTTFDLADVGEYVPNLDFSTATQSSRSSFVSSVSSSVASDRRISS